MQLTDIYLNIRCSDTSSGDT